MLKDYFKLSFLNLRHRRLRSWLTMLGIFIGIAAVVALVSLGQGLNNAIKEQFERLGADKITIMAKVGEIVSPVASAISNKPLTEKDLKIVENIKEVKEVTGFLMKSAEVEYKNEKRSVLVVGIDPKAEDMFKGSYEVEKGGSLKGDEKFKVNIGYNIANSDFKKKISIGNKVFINGKEFRVTGILKKTGSLDDSSIYMPLDAAREFLNEPKLLSMLFAQVKEVKNVDKVKDEIEKEMKRDRGEDRKEKPQSFSVQTSEQILQTFGNILNVVQAVLVGIAAISLFVGGIGIMNTMYTAILERTREIGIMKAIGAKNSDVLILFLIESGLLGLVGGVIGILLGMGISKTVEIIAFKILGTSLLKAHISLQLIFGALAFSFIIGALSGTLPALQASRMKPIDALRHE